MPHRRTTDHLRAPCRNTGNRWACRNTSNPQVGTSPLVSTSLLLNMDRLLARMGSIEAIGVIPKWLAFCVLSR
jgi:hypothetical protein